MIKHDQHEGYDQPRRVGADLQVLGGGQATGDEGQRGPVPGQERPLVGERQPGIGFDLLPRRHVRRPLPNFIDLGLRAGLRAIPASSRLDRCVREGMDPGQSLRQFVAESVAGSELAGCRVDDRGLAVVVEDQDLEG